MNDITDSTKLITSDQKEGVANVEGGTIFNIAPDFYKEQKFDFEPELKQAQFSPYADPVVARNIAKSSEHAAALAPDAQNLSYIERQFKYVGNRIKGVVGEEQELAQLGYNKAIQGQMGANEHTEDDEFRRLTLVQAQKKNFGRDDYGVTGPWETIPGSLAAGAVDFGQMFMRNKETFGAIVGLEAAAGAGIGLVGGPAGAAAGAASGAIGGAVTSIPFVSAVDSFKTTTGMTYNALDAMTDDPTMFGRNLNIDENTKRSLATGTGVIAGAIGFGASKLFLNSVPWLKGMGTQAWAQKLASLPAMNPMRLALTTLGQAAINGGEAGTIEIAKIAAEEIGKTYKNSEVSFMDGLIAASKRIGDERVLEATKGGAVTGTGLGLALHGAGALVRKGATKVRDAQRGNPDAPIRNVTPDEPPLLPPGPSTDIVINPDDASPTTRVQEVLDAQDAFEASAHVMKNTEISKLSKPIASDLRKQMLTEAGVDHVFVDTEDLQKLATTTDRAEVVRKMIDQSGAMAEAARINAPLQIPAHIFADTLDELPDLGEHFKLSPEGPSPNSARVYAENLQKNATMRAEFQEKLNLAKTDEERAEIQASMNQALGDQSMIEQGMVPINQEVAELKARRDAGEINEKEYRKLMKPIGRRRKALIDQATGQPSNDVFGEADYMNQPTFTKAIESVIGEKKVARLNEAWTEAKQEVVNVNNYSAERERAKTARQMEPFFEAAAFDDETERLANNPRVALVDRFTATTDFLERANNRYVTPEEAKGAHYKPGFPTFAMDPRLLTPEQKEKYRGSPLLKKHKAFVKGGMSPDDAAELLGVQNGEKLLEILSTTDNRDSIIEGRVKKRRAEIAKDALDSTDYDHAALAKAYNKKTFNHLVELNYLKDERWSALIEGFKAIALPIPTVEELVSKAKAVTNATKVGQLNANQYAVGERKSNRIAIDAITKQDVRKAFVNKEAAALNSELTAATRIAIDKARINRRKIARMDSETVRQEMKDAGPLFLDAYDEVMDTYGFRPQSVKRLKEQSSFSKFVKSQIEAGFPNMELPERLTQVKTNINDMTVEELQAITDLLTQVVHQGRRKNQLWEKFGDPAKDLQTVENFAEMVRLHVLENPDYKPNRTQQKSHYGPTETLLSWADNALSVFKNMEHILLHADNGQVGGFLQTEIVAPLKGIGKHAGQGEAGKGADIKAATEHFSKLVDRFNGERSVGKKIKDAALNDDFANMANRKIQVPELKDNAIMRNGDVTEEELFAILLNMGNQGNLDRLMQNNGIDEHTANVITSKYLDERHGVLAQAMFEMADSYWGRTTKLYEETNGVVPERVESKPIYFKGKMMKGGWYPIAYKPEMIVKTIIREVENKMKGVTGEVENKIPKRFDISEMTKNGHMKERTGSAGRALDLSLKVFDNTIETIIHELNFKKPVMNAMRILTHPEIAGHIAGVVGVPDLNVLVNSVVDLATSAKMDRHELFHSTRIFDRVSAHMRSGMSVGYLVGNVGSFLIQPTSMIAAIERLGPTGALHIGNTVRQLTQYPHLIPAMYEVAGEILPTIREFQEEISENLSHGLAKKIPRGSMIKAGAPITVPIAKMGEIVKEIGFNALGSVDQVQKVIVSVSAYRQFMAGDAPGFPLDKVRAMSVTDRDHQAKVYASAVARMTLTAGSKMDKAPIQKWAPAATMFFNDPRNILNNQMRMAREIRQDAQAGTSGARQLLGAGRAEEGPNQSRGDGAKKAGKGYGLAAWGTLTMAMTAAAMLMYEQWLRAWLMDKDNGPIKPQEGEGAVDYIKRQTSWERVPWVKKDNESPEEYAQRMIWDVATAPIELAMQSAPGVRDIKFQYDLQKAQEQNRPYAHTTVTTPITKIYTDIKDTAIIASHFMEYVDGQREMTAKDAKVLGFAASYVTGGLPINGAFRLAEFAKKNAPDVSLEGFLQNKAEADVYAERVNQFKETQATLPEAQKVSPEVMRALEMIKDQMAPEEAAARDVNSVLEETVGLIKHIESRGKWNAKNPNSSAAGLYQFLEGTWEDIMERAPELKLTMAGRTSKVTSQQERAMRWFTKQNINKLLTNDVELTPESIYAAHFLGAAKAVDVLKASGNVKLKSLVGQDVIDSNTNFTGNTRVRDFKRWLRMKVGDARRATGKLADAEESTDAPETVTDEGDVEDVQG